MGADATVLGRLDVEIPAISKLESLRAESGRADDSLKRLGRTLDGLGGSRSTQGIRAVRDELKALTRQASTTSTEVSREWDRMVRGIETGATKASTAIAGVRKELGELGREHATAKVDVDGIATSMAELEELDRKLDAFGRKHATATARVRSSGGLPGGIPGGGSGGRNGDGRGLPGGGSGLPRIPGGGGGGGLPSLPFGPSPLMIAAVTPLVPPLVGSITALAGSLASAAVGFTEMGVAAGGVALAGLGSIAAVAIPAVSTIGQVIKAQDALTSARQNSLSVTDQHRSAVQAVAAAEWGVVTAQRTVRTSTEDLTIARRDAKRAIIDMTLAERSARLEAESGQIGLLRARQALMRAQLNPLSTPLDLQEAQLGVKQAHLQVDQNRVQVGRTAQDAARARRRGVEGSRSVRDAEFGIRSARQGLTQAQIGLANATRTLARGTGEIASAKQALDEAFANAPSGTRRLVADVQKLRSLFGLGAGEGRGGISPAIDKAQRMFVRIADRAVGSIGRIAGLIGRTAQIALGGLGRMQKIFSRFLNSKEFARDMIALSRAFAQNAPGIAVAMTNVARAFLNISVAISPFLKQGTAWMVRVTRGWRETSSQTGKVQRNFRSHLADLKTWWALLKATGRLLTDLLNGGRVAGRNMVQDLTGTLRKWDRWVKGHPGKIRQFMRESVKTTERVFAVISKIVGALWNLGRALQPIVGLASSLATTLAPLLGTPGGLGVAFAGYRALSGLGGRGGGGGGAAGGMMPWLFGSKGSGGRTGGLIRNYRGARSMGDIGRLSAARFAMEEGGGGLGRVASAMGGSSKLLGLGKVGGMAMGALGKLAWPIMAFQGGLAALAKQGTAGERAQSALHATTFGLIHDSLTNVDKRSQGQRYAGQFLEGVSNDPRFHGFQTIRGVRGGIDKVSEEMARIKGMGHLTDRAGGLFKASIRDQEQYNKLLRARNTFIRQGNRLHDEASVRKAMGLGAQLGGVYDAYLRKAKDAKEASADTVGSINRKMKMMRREGVLTLGQISLDWARHQVKLGKMTRGAYDQLKGDVLDRLTALKSNASIINGQIFRDSDSAWKGIHDSLTGWAEKTLEKNTESFTKMQEQAVHGLRQMGFSRSQARDIVSATERGGRAGQAAGSIASSGSTTASTHGSLAPVALGGKATGATGMRIRGQGLQDNVSVAPGHLAAPGELIVNRHTESRLDKLLNMFGTSMGREVASETKPHSYARGGRLGGLAGDQIANARAIIGVGRHMHVPYKALLAAVETGIVESSLHNLHGGDRDSQGVFQQRPSQGWGTPAQVTDVRHAAASFFSRAIPLARSAGSAGNLAQSVQRSAFPARYDQQQRLAALLLSGLGAGGGAGMGGGGGGGGGLRIKIPRSHMAGIPGGLQQGAYNIYGAGLQRLVDRAARSAPGMGGGGGGGGAGGPMPSGANYGHQGATAFNPIVLRAIKWAQAHGWHGTHSGLRSYAEQVRLYREKGPRFAAKPGTSNHGTGDAIDVSDTEGFARAMANAPRNARLRRGMSWEPWHFSLTGFEKGGRVGDLGTPFGGWYGGGGSMRVRRPMMIGVGDGQPSGGSEEVHVRRVAPNGSVTGGGHQVHVEVHMGGVQVGSGTGADARTLADNVAETVAKRLTAALERNS